MLRIGDEVGLIDGIGVEVSLEESTTEFEAVEASENKTKRVMILVSRVIHQ